MDVPRSFLGLGTKNRRPIFEAARGWRLLEAGNAFWQDVATLLFVNIRLTLGTLLTILVKGLSLNRCGHT